jgi:flagellar hook protein FlgE
MASFSIPLTGLQAESTALNTIANNLANMNTTAFKSQSTQFSDLFYQQIGSSGAGDPIQVGAGTKVASNSTAFTQGSISSTGKATDVALNGNGFFVVGNGQGGFELTRAGKFSIDTKGNLVSGSGLSVMGYAATNGVVNTNGPLAPMNIPVGQVLAPRATTAMSMTMNLNSSSAVGTQFPGEATVYDSLGDPHVVTITYTKTAANTWDYSAALPAADFASGTSTAVTGTLSFDSSGNLQSIDPGSTGTASTVGTGPGEVASVNLAFAGLADGAANLNMQWNLLGANNAPVIGQVSTTSAASSTSQDGFASGQYQDFTVNSGGIITVSYSNGQKQNIGQLALANVSNLQGLALLGDGNYGTTLASGTASIATSGANGLGTLQNGALEGSNVNISSEFANLIVAQRAFEANAKSVTTFDSVTQDTINMVR